MFRVTRAEEQAVRLIMRLAILGRLVTLAELADCEDLPEPTVAKLLGQLRRAGVVEAVRGRNGGYLLVAAPESISAAVVIGAVGSETAFGYPCREGNGQPDCSRSDQCGLRPVWQHLENRVNSILRQTSIADLVAYEMKSESVRDKHWPPNRN